MLPAQCIHGDIINFVMFSLKQSSLILLVIIHQLPLQRILHKTHSECIWTMACGCFILFCPLLLRNYGNTFLYPGTRQERSQLCLLDSRFVLLFGLLFLLHYRFFHNSSLLISSFFYFSFYKRRKEEE